MKRVPGELTQPPEGPIVNLGPGKYDRKLLPHRTVHLGLPEWRAPWLDFRDGTIAQFHAYHFFEHLHSVTAITMLREIERCLKPGGVAYIVVPHSAGMMAFQDITHKSFWNEDTFKQLFSNPNYDPAGEWELEVTYQIIAAVASRNLALFVQLEKVVANPGETPGNPQN